MTTLEGSIKIIIHANEQREFISPEKIPEFYYYQQQFLKLHT